MSWILLSITVCVCAVPKHALKYMIMTLTTIISKQDISTIIFYNTNYKFYISFCSSFSALLKKIEIFLLGGVIHILCSYV